MATSTPIGAYRPEIYTELGDIRCKYVEYFVNKHAGKLNWRGGESVIDIGCGTGDVTRQCFFPLLPRNFHKFILADLSPKMLNFARKEFHGMEHVDFLQMDIAGQLEKNLMGDFDKCFSSLCLMHVRDQRRSFENIYKLLAPHGECFVILMVNAALFQTGFRLAETPKWEQRLKHFRDVFIFPYRNDAHPEETIGNLLEEIGFRDVFVKKEDFFHLYPLYPTVENFRETLKCTRDFPNCMSDVEKDEFLEERVNLGVQFNVVEEFYDPSRPFGQKPFENLTIYAKK